MYKLIIAKYDESSIKGELYSLGFVYVENLKCYQAHSSVHSSYCAEVVELKIAENGSISIFLDDVTSTWCIEKATEAMKVLQKGKYIEKD